MRIETSDLLLFCDNSDETKQKLFHKIVDFFVERELFNGESITQSDVVSIDAPQLLSEIAEDILKFDVKFK